MKDDNLAGVAFEPIEFTPKSSAYAGQSCHGIKLEVTGRDVFEPVRTGIAIALALRGLYPDAWHPDKLNQIIGNAAVTDAILSLRPLEEIEALWSSDLAAFRQKREKYLLYPSDPAADGGAP
jgi:uncharacterized protein YbbC (DUF1343 family)